MRVKYIDDYLNPIQVLKRDLGLESLCLAGYDSSGQAVHIYIDPNLIDEKLCYLIQCIKDRRDIMFNNHLDEF